MAITTVYICGECGAEWDSLAEAEGCCSEEIIEETDEDEENEEEDEIEED